MKFKLITITTMICLIFSSYAVVPTVNATDPVFTAKYSGKALGYLKWIANAKDTADQIKGLKGLQQMQKGGESLCSLCSPIDLKDLQLTMDGLNGGLCQSFSQIMTKLTGLQKQYDNLNEVQSALSTNPAEAALALQQASVQSQIHTEETLQQMQAMQAQKMQKDIVEEKIQNQARNDIWKGMSN